MAQQKIVWTVLPYGRVTDGELAGRLRCSIVVSPRLTPASAAENVLSAFPDFLDWPARLAQARFSLTVGPVTLPLAPLGKVDKDPWDQIFGAKTPVTDFAFTDMTAVNLRSYSVRNVLRFIKASYGALAATSGAWEYNIASQRISAKLGYRQTGTRLLAPRGEPVTHYDYRLEAVEWHSPIAVELLGLDDCLPLFGALPRSG